MECCRPTLSWARGCPHGSDEISPDVFPHSWLLDNSGYPYPATLYRRFRLLRLGAFGQLLIDAVLQGDQQTEHDKRARRQNRQQEAFVVAEYGDLPVRRDGAEQQVHVGEQRAGAEQLAQAAQYQQYQREAHSHDESVVACDQRFLLGREAVGAAEDHAVGGDQRYEDAQY